MFTNTKIALVAAFVLGAASAALANDIDVNPSSAQSAREWAQYLGHKQKHETAFALNTCPALEGYPDCHPDDSASWAQYSTAGESMAQKKSPAKFKGMRRERKPEGRGAIPASM
jgi:hypothetical protein